MLFLILNALRKPKQEHLDKVSDTHSLVEFVSPYKLAKKTGHSLTAVKCVLEEISKYDSIYVKDTASESQAICKTEGTKC